MGQEAPASNTNGADPFATTTLYPTTAPDPVQLLGRHSDPTPSKFTPSGLGSGSRGSLGGLGSGSGSSVTAKGDEIVDVLAVDRTRRQSGSGRLSRHSSEKDEDEEIASCRYDVERSSISSEKLPIRPSSSKSRHSEGSLGKAAKLETKGKNSLAVGDVELGDIDDDLDVRDGDLQGRMTSAPAAKQTMFRVDSQPIDVHTAVVGAFIFHKFYINLLSYILLAQETVFPHLPILIAVCCLHQHTDLTVVSHDSGHVTHMTCIM